MEDDEDDFYGEGDAEPVDADVQVAAEDEPMVSAGEDDEDEDSDDDVQFTLEKPAGGVGETTSQARKPAASAEPVTISSDKQQQQPKGSSAARQESQQRAIATDAPALSRAPASLNGKEGKDYPEVRTSKLDVNAIPVWPGSGKPITEIDIDADLAEHSKPWRQPGVDQTDFFNYGFDEYTWAQYCVRQQTMANTIEEGKQADAQMKALLGGGGGPGGGMPGMPGMGMSDMDPQMAQMMQQAMAGGMPSLDQFMQSMGGMGPGGFGGAGFGMGPGQNNNSPHPQGNQGFQPPTGPAAGPMGGMGMENMDGYSQQQINIMQQQGGGMGQGGGRRAGRGRGRGYY